MDSQTCCYRMKPIETHKHTHAIITTIRKISGWNLRTYCIYFLFLSLRFYLPFFLSCVLCQQIQSFFTTTKRWSHHLHFFTIEIYTNTHTHIWELDLSFLWHSSSCSSSFSSFIGSRPSAGTFSRRHHHQPEIQNSDVPPNAGYRKGSSRLTVILEGAASILDRRIWEILISQGSCSQGSPSVWTGRTWSPINRMRMSEPWAILWALSMLACIFPSWNDPVTATTSKRPSSILGRLNWLSWCFPHKSDPPAYEGRLRRMIAPVDSCIEWTFPSIYSIQETIHPFIHSSIKDVKEMRV